MVYQFLLILAAFILIYSLFATRFEKTALSGPFLALIVGFIFGPLVLGLLDIKIASEDYRLIAELALALVLFTDASKANLRVLENNYTLPTRMLIIGLPLTIVFGMAGGFLIFKDFSWIELGILATILAPTDAALGKAVVINKSVPSKIREALNVESGLNDGIAVPVLFLFMAFTTLETGTGAGFTYGLGLFVREIGVGLVVGIGITFGIEWLIRYANERNWISESWKPFVIIALAITCFTVAQVAGGSGFIACFSGGFLYGILNRKHKIKTDLLESAEGAGDTMSLITWLIFGALVIAPFLQSFTWDVVIYALLSLTIIRIIPVLISLTGTSTSWKEKLFMGWFGPRGLASIVFAVIILDVDLPHRPTIILTIVCTILFSVILHGLTAKPFIKGLSK